MNHYISFRKKKKIGKEHATFLARKKERKKERKSGKH